MEKRLLIIVNLLPTFRFLCPGAALTEIVFMFEAGRTELTEAAVRMRRVRRMDAGLLHRAADI